VIVADSMIVPLLPGPSRWTIPDGGLSVLNNTHDGIYLLDMTGVIIDSLLYSENWGLIDHRSMEKYRPEFSSNDSSRWAVAVNESGITPGEKNSIYYHELAKAGSLVLSPNPFSPDGDGFDDLLYIKYKLPFEYGLISIQIFDYYRPDHCNTLLEYLYRSGEYPRLGRKRTRWQTRPDRYVYYSTQSEGYIGESFVGRCPTNCIGQKVVNSFSHFNHTRGKHG